MLLRYSTCRTVRSKKERSFRTSIADLGHVQPMLVPSPPEEKHTEDQTDLIGGTRTYVTAFPMCTTLRQQRGSMLSNGQLNRVSLVWVLRYGRGIDKFFLKAYMLSPCSRYLSLFMMRRLAETFHSVVKLFRPPHRFFVSTRTFDCDRPDRSSGENSRLIY